MTYLLSYMAIKFNEKKKKSKLFEKNQLIRF